VPFPLEQRLRRHGRAVGEAFHRGSDHRLRRYDRLFLPARGRHLGRRQPPVDEQCRICKRSSHVDAEDRHSGMILSCAGSRS
jgi:hypothetical protein